MLLPAASGGRGPQDAHPVRHVRPAWDPRERRTLLGMEKTGPSFGARILAAVVLAIAVWILFKLIIGAIAAIAWIVALVVAAIAIVWAVRTLF